MKRYTLYAQVLVKIVFHDLLPKSGEYSHACGCAPVLIYCLLKGIRVNISRLIIDFMLSDHLLIPTRYLPYRMILTRLFMHLKINLSDEKAVTPFVDISSTLLRRMHVGAHIQAPPHLSSPPVQNFAFGSSSSAVDPYAGMMTQLSDLSMLITSSAETVLANKEAIWREQQI